MCCLRPTKANLRQMALTHPSEKFDMSGMETAIEKGCGKRYS